MKRIKFRFKYCEETLFSCDNWGNEEWSEYTTYKYKRLSYEELIVFLHSSYEHTDGWMNYWSIKLNGKYYKITPGTISHILKLAGVLYA